MRNFILASLLFFCTGLPAQQWMQLMQNPAVNYYTVEQSYLHWKDSAETVQLFSGNRDSEDREEYLEEMEEIYNSWASEFKLHSDAFGNLISPEQMRREYQAGISRNGNNTFQQMQGTWINRGPFDIDTAYFVRGIGRAVSIAIDPNDTNLIYVAASGALWRSVDNGNNWIVYLDSALNFPVTKIFIDPVHGDTLYAEVSGKLFKSSDAGHNWNLLNVGVTVGFGNYFNLLIDPLNSENLILNTSTGIRKSTNGGLTWNVINTGTFYDVQMNPLNPAVLYGFYSNRIYRSNDSGQNWVCTDTITGNSYPVNALAVTLADTNYVYVMASNSNGSGGQVACSTTGGYNFTLQPSSTSMFTSSTMYNFAVSPVDKQVLYWGSLNSSRSVNGGLTWSFIYSSALHVDQRDILVKGASFWACNDGGVTKSVDQGANWSDKTRTMGIAQFNALTCYQADTAVFMGGTVDDASILHTSTGWMNIFQGDNYNTAINPGNTQIMFCKSQYNYQRTINGGLSFNGGIFTGLTESAYGFSAVYPLIYNAQNIHSMYLLVDNVWKSTNDGNNVTRISNFPSNTGGGFLYICESDTDIIFTKYYRTVDGGANWTPTSKVILAVDPDEPNKVWGQNYFYSPLALFFSNDTGNTWTEISSIDILPVTTVMYLRCANNNFNGVYFFSGGSIFYIDDRLSNWQPFNNGLSYATITDMKVLYNHDKVRISTYGRGIWESNLYDANQPLQAAFISNRTSLCPGDTVRFFDNSLNNGPGFNPQYQWSFPGGTPSVSTQANPVVVYNTPGTYNVTLNITNSNGSDQITQSLYITVSTPPVATLPLTEGFESTFYPAGWNVNHYNSFPGWKWSPVYLNTYGGYEQSARSIIYFKNVYDTTSGRDYFTSPSVDLTNLNTPAVIFDYIYAYEGGLADTLKVFYTTDCGMSRHYLYSNGGLNLQTLSIGNTSYFPDSANWRTDTVSLNSIASLTDVQVGFEMISRGRCDFYLDNINIDNGPATPLAPGEFTQINLSVFPNPVNDQLSVHYPAGLQNPVLIIYDATGKVCLKKSIQTSGTSGSFDVSFLPAGFYSVRIETTDNLVANAKFSIVR